MHTDEVALFCEPIVTSSDIRSKCQQETLPLASLTVVFIFLFLMVPIIVYRKDLIVSMMVIIINFSKTITSRVVFEEFFSVQYDI